MVDHTFLFTGAVRKIKELVDGGVLGPLYYYDSTRVNLGLFQHDVNVIWDLAPHDLSIMDYLIGLEPDLVVATGGAHLNGMEDMAYITLYFPKNIIAHINVNWLSPVKVRTTLIGGQRKMLVWNDLEPAEKIKVYDKGVEVGNGARSSTSSSSATEAETCGRPGWRRAEALQLEARYFLDCVASGTTPFNDGRAGLRVVRILEAADESLKRRSEIVFASSRRPSVERRCPLRFRPVPLSADDHAAPAGTHRDHGSVIEGMGESVRTSSTKSSSRDALIRERKRSDRSNRPFGLLLVDVNDRPWRCFLVDLGRRHRGLGGSQA